MHISGSKESLQTVSPEGITEFTDISDLQAIEAGVRSTAAEHQLEDDVERRYVWDYEEILSILGFGKTQWILLLVSGLMTMTAMAAQLSVGIIAIAAQCEFEMSQSEKGVMMAACVLGNVLSTYIFGYISDVWGRRSVLVWTMFITVFLQFVTMFVTNVWLFNLINFIMGISLGGSDIIYAYLCEFNTAKYRAIVINYSTMFVSISAIYVPATSWLVLSSDWSLDITDSFTFRPWRLIILFSLLPGLIATVLLLPFPESPKFLLAQDKGKEALKAIDWIAKFNTGIRVEAILETTSIALKPEELADSDVLSGSRGFNVISNIWKATVPLFYKPHGVNVTLAVIAMFGMFFSSNGMQIWYPEIVNRSAGGSSLNSSLICDVLDESFRQDKENIIEASNAICDNTISSKTYIDNMIMGFAFLIGFSIQGTLLNPLGRKNVLLAALSVGVLSGILLHIVSNSTGVLILFCLYIILPGLSISIMCGAMVDLVPTHLRGKAVTLALTLGRLGIIVASNWFAVMLEPYCNGTFAMVTSSIVVCGALVYFLPI